MAVLQKLFFAVYFLNYFPIFSPASRAGKLLLVTQSSRTWVESNSLALPDGCLFSLRRERCLFSLLF